MSHFEVLTKGKSGNDLPHQASDDELLAWTEQLRHTKPRRRQLVAEPIE